MNSENLVRVLGRLALLPTLVVSVVTYSVSYFVSYSIRNIVWIGIVKAVKDGWNETFSP